MNPPRLIRPLRPFLQGQLPLTAPRSAVVGIPRTSTQLRTYASVETPSAEQKSSAAPPAQTAKSGKPGVSRMPRALEALYLKPLRREVEYGVPSCNLQLRSYSVRNLEFFCDFALRAAYYLGLPAFGPVPLPRIVQRWTVPKSTFIFKKSQENFERITLRRMIQIRDGNPETVQVWLAFLQKHAYYGIGMKANVWEFSKLGVGQEMDKNLEQTEKLMEDKWEHLSYVERRPEYQKKKDRGPREQLPAAEEMEEFLASERRKIAGGRAFASGSPGDITTVTPITPGTEVEPPEPKASEDVLDKAFSSNEPSVIFSGIQPTGEPHLGNYLGALRQWKRLQDTAHPKTKLFFCIVDMHAITTPRPRDELQHMRWKMMASLLALGLDPDRCTIFFQSTVPQHAELQWILSCTASTGYLSRMTQWKSKLNLAENTTMENVGAKGLKHGLFSYPILQAADILLYGTTHVPVGEDQRQHLEFTRECVTNFNHAYKTKCLVAPRTLLSPTRRVMSLTKPTEKMSKSDPSSKSRVLITHTPNQITARINGATTDSLNEVTYEPEARPGVANLINILSGFDPQGRSPEQLGEQTRGYKIRELKELVSQVVTDELAEVRERFAALESDKDKLREISAQGTEKARCQAEKTMAAVKKAIGFSG
ncbi:hypothetical protein B0I37DRAFT_413168 [Chaetomium sp. MPI-CAGE-AT-0009]|nr:hypothetical protein B0I37DRAFT_413168 [Chaetomium sp. MPI-CAGE-AT-0009]